MSFQQVFIWIMRTIVISSKQLMFICNFGENRNGFEGYFQKLLFWRCCLKMDKTPSLPLSSTPRPSKLETRDSCPGRETNPIEHISETLDSTISPTLETRRFLPGTCQLQDPNGIQRAGESPSVKLFVIDLTIRLVLSIFSVFSHI